MTELPETLSCAGWPRTVHVTELGHVLSAEAYRTAEGA